MSRAHRHRGARRRCQMLSGGHKFRPYKRKPAATLMSWGGINESPLSLVQQARSETQKPVMSSDAKYSEKKHNVLRSSKGTQCTRTVPHPSPYACTQQTSAHSTSKEHHNSKAHQRSGNPWRGRLDTTLGGARSLVLARQ